MKKRIAVYSFLMLLLTSLSAQQPVNQTSADMYLSLRKLNVLGSVLYVAAHPDDENTRLLTYLSKDKLYRTGYLSITRGDGGQNLIGYEQGVELGLIRTQELLAARRIDGAEQYFTRAFDFGYSKTPEETFEKWNKEKILSDVVWIIRSFQPDVIITRFPATGEGGHGHHTASAILANEAFTVAADPLCFPEQLQYVKPWQAKRILWNTYNFGGINTTRDDQFMMDVGGYNPLLGKSYGEIAAESRSQHKSQGFGVPRSRGEAIEFFSTTNGTAPVHDLMDGVETGWKKINGGEKIEMIVDSLVKTFDFLQPAKTVKGLVILYQAIAALPASHWKNKKLKETLQLIETYSGLWVEATTAQEYAVRGDSLKINLYAINRTNVDATVKGYFIENTQGREEMVKDYEWKNSLLNNQARQRALTIAITEAIPYSQPYWLQEPMQGKSFQVKEQAMIGLPENEASLRVGFFMNIEGTDFVFYKPVLYKHTNPVKGELYQPLAIIPAFDVKIPDAIKIHRKDNKKNWRYNLLYKANKNLTSIKIYNQKQLIVHDTMDIAKGVYREWSAAIDMASVSNDKISESEKFSFKYFYQLNAERASTLHSISYDHIPSIHYFTQAVSEFVVLDIKTSGKKIGYIAGAGDKVPEALQQLGYEVTLLGDKELSRNNLQQFDAIISGVRAYNTNEWLNNHYERLMNYVREGGNYIVQYNTSTQRVPLRTKIGPYNFHIFRTRVTDENAHVTFLNPGHPVLNFPNKITQNDFKGWIQERSIYHATDWGKNFVTILAMNDPGEKPDAGSLIIANYGKGTFVYTGVVFFRQLPAGVPGAYRLLANLIALNRKKAFQ